MRRMLIVFSAAVVLAAGLLPANAQDVDELIAKYVEARGGREAWDAIDSIKVTGDFTAFSKVNPFTLHRTSDDKYFADFLMGDKIVVVGYDGELAWWDNHWYKEGAQEIAGADLAVVMRDVEFAPALFNYEMAGHEVELLGQVEVEGIPAIGIKLTRNDDSTETYYLDPSTYLEIARDSPGSDFGRAMEQRTWYDDFRDVAGAKMPFFTETQWYTRDRVMRVAKIEVNVELSDDMFRMPAPPGMGSFVAMAGDWNVSMEQRRGPQAEFAPGERQSTIVSELRGALMREHYISPEGAEVYRTLSYDANREQYRVTEISSSNSFMDILEGSMAEDGRLTVSNFETGTPAVYGETIVHGRLAYFDISRNSFKIEYEATLDGGENWWVAAKATYDRRTETDGGEAD
jgi:hypothetical protein